VATAGLALVPAAIPVERGIEGLFILAVERDIFAAESAMRIDDDAAVAGGAGLFGLRHRDFFAGEAGGDRRSLPPHPRIQHRAAGFAVGAPAGRD